MVAADARTAIIFALSPGHDHDAPHGRALLEELGPMPEGLPMLMDRAYEGNETRQLVLDLGMIPVVPPSPIGCVPGTTIRPFTKSATRSNVCSAGSKASAVSSRASRSSTPSSWGSSHSHSSSKRFG